MPNARRRPARSFPLPVLLVAAVAALSACGSAASSDATPASDGGACAVQPTFTSIQARVLSSPTCALSGCHATPGQSGLSLDGSPDAVYAALVGVPSHGSLMQRVAPGAPASSFLYAKLSEETPPSGTRMPQAAAPLDACEIDAVRAWIAAGAPRE
jgi:hypothetical protein